MESEDRRGEKGMHGTELLQAVFSPLVSRGMEGLVFCLRGGGFLFCGDNFFSLYNCRVV